MQEIWRTIEDYPRYEVSNWGRIKNKSFKKILSPYDKGGYLKIQIVDKDGIQRKPSIHQLVAKAFHENPLNKPDIHHIDHNKHNNRADNLMWVTPQENNSYNLCIYPVVSMHRPKSIASRDYYEINGALFTNLKSAAVALHMPAHTIKKLCLDPKVKNFRYIPPKYL